MANEQVLVTGGSGFIGAHCILQLLDAGYRVRTTVRSLKREPDVRAMLETGGVSPNSLDRLTFFVADLEQDAGWPEAVDRCDYVLHVASPLPPSVPKHEDELIIPAREGTLRVLRAARDAGVRRVVLTSSFAAIGYGHSNHPAPFNETDWTELNGDVLPYPDLFTSTHNEDPPCGHWSVTGGIRLPFLPTRWSATHTPNPSNSRPVRAAAYSSRIAVTGFRRIARCAGR
jgi:nucleoside-diphosphate-sugar epimerase